MKRFDQQVCFITGASSGIGEALALELARRGAILALAARREEKLGQVVERIRAQGGKAFAVRCDVTRDGDCEAAIAATVREFGRVDVAIANAGFGVAGALTDLKVEDYRRQFETNVFGVLRTIYASVGELRKSQGCAVFVGSVAGHISLPGGSAYAMSKFAVRALAEGIDEELRSQGVGVVLISPGFVDSEFRRVDNNGVLHAGVVDPVPPWIRVPATNAAREIADAIACRRSERIVTFHGKILVFLNRLFPWLLRWVKRVGVRARPEPSAGR